MKIPMGKLLKWSAVTLFLLFMLIQAVPYGRDHDNPPVLREPHWDSPETRAVTKRACFGCHSNETVWPWYSHVAPFSWLVASDVEEGRKELNFSQWQGGRLEGEKPAELRKEIEEGEMPPLTYRIIHPEASLKEKEKRQLIDGLTATVEQSRF